MPPQRARRRPARAGEIATNERELPYSNETLGFGGERSEGRPSSRRYLVSQLSFVMFHDRSHVCFGKRLHNSPHWVANAQKPTILRPIRRFRGDLLSYVRVIEQLLETLEPWAGLEFRRDSAAAITSKEAHQHLTGAATAELLREAPQVSTHGCVAATELGRDLLRVSSACD
jgi:hypothetical protein